MTEYNLSRDFKNNINEFWGFPFEQLSFSFENEAISESLNKQKPNRTY